MTCRMTVFLMENRTSSPGKKRTWGSGWPPPRTVASQALLGLLASENGINRVASQRDSGLEEKLRVPQTQEFPPKDSTVNYREVPANGLPAENGGNRRSS